MPYAWVRRLQSVFYGLLRGVMPEHGVRLLFPFFHGIHVCFSVYGSRVEMSFSYYDIFNIRDGKSSLFFMKQKIYAKITSFLQ